MEVWKNIYQYVSTIYYTTLYSISVLYLLKSVILVSPLCVFLLLQYFAPVNMLVMRMFSSAIFNHLPPIQFQTKA